MLPLHLSKICKPVGQSWCTLRFEKVALLHLEGRKAMRSRGGFEAEGDRSTLYSLKIQSAGEDRPRADGEGQVKCRGPTSS